MANNNNPQLNMDQVRGLLSPYLDGEVTDEERTLVERALAASVELRRELESLRRTVAMVAVLPSMPAPRPFTLTEAMVRPSAPPAKGFLGLPRWAMGWASLAATLLCVLVAGGLFWTMQFGGRSAPAMAPAEIAVAPTKTAPVAAQAPAAAKPAEKPAAKQEVPTEIPPQAPQPQMAAPAPTATPQANTLLAKPSTDEAAGGTAPQAAEDTTVARQATEAETANSASEQTAEGYAATAAAPAPTATPSPEPTLMTFAAPTGTEEQTMSAAQSEPQQPAPSSAQAPAAAAQPGPELSKQQGAAQPAEVPPTTTPLPTATSSPTRTPTPLPSPTSVALLTLPAPLTPTTTAAPVAETASPRASSWLISMGIIVVLLALLGIGLFMGIRRNKGRP